MVLRRLALSAMTLLLSQTAQAQEDSKVGNLLTPLLACLDKSVDPIRLACLDQEARKLRETQQKSGVVVLNRKKAAAIQLSAQRSEYFFREKDLRETIATFSPITAPLTNATQSNGIWMFNVEGHGTWMQAEQRELGRDPQPGDMIRIRRGAIGGFLLNVQNGPAIRVKPVL